MYVYVISLLASVFIVAFISFKVGAALSNRGRRLLETSREHYALRCVVLMCLYKTVPSMKNEVVP
jgi:hypothetical protein